MFVSRFVMFALALLAFAAPAKAESYPDHVVKIIVPYPAGGSVDITARLLAQKLSDETGHSFIVETRSGAGGNTGADFVAKSDPDGYTLLFTAPGPLTVNQTPLHQAAAVRSGEGLRAGRDLRADAGGADGQSGMPAKNVKELIEYTKTKSGQVNFGSAGIGTIPHLAGELFKSLAKVEITHVPYRGTAPRDGRSRGRPHRADVRSAAVEPAADQRQDRSSARERGRDTPDALKDLPTVAEQGLAGFDASSWVALVAPSHTPTLVLAKLRADVGKAMASPDMVKRLAELGSEAGTADEQKARAFLASETTKWAEVIKASGAKVE